MPSAEHCQAGAPPPLLDLVEVCKRYDGHSVLGPLNLTCPAGQTTVLLGPSGCGKSTLLRLIAGLIHADTGAIRLGDHLLSAQTLASLRRQMGYVIQDGGLFPHLTVRGNVTLMARHLCWERTRIDTRLRTLADLVQLPAALYERYPVELSGGQRQRVGLMRALMLDPPVVLLDEPLGALDPMIRYDLQQQLRGIFRQLHKTVVLVTHDIGEAAFLGEQIVLLRHGLIIQRGAWKSFLDTPAEPFVERFISAQRNPLQLAESGSC